jgi:SAM-dependent methyltransferase
LLDIGVGPGVITAALSQAAGPEGDVWGVDLADERQVQAGFGFKLTEDTALPFDAGSFDVVVSNHVIEHVGDNDAQLAHLSEISRVLAPGGICYLATPSRWAPIEPHYKVPLLSWLPERMRSPYLRLTGRGSVYDCNPLGYRDLLRLFRRTGLRHADRTTQAMRIMARTEGRGGLTGRLLEAPGWFIAVMRPVIPTMVFLLFSDSHDG